MEILSDTTFRGKATFTKGFDVTGTTPVSFANSLVTTIGRLCIGSGLPLYVGGKDFYFYDGGTVLTDRNIKFLYGASFVYTGSFENPTIPSGCKKFAINPDTAKKIMVGMNPDSAKPYIAQIRKVSNNELLDITISDIGSGHSEFVFERASTDEIPESYFKTTWIQVQ